MTAQMIPADQFQADLETRRKNEERQNGNHADVCFLCGRGLTAKALESAKYIHLHTAGLLIPAGTKVDENHDQGCFPMGSECAKRVPAEYRIKF